MRHLRLSVLLNISALFMLLIGLVVLVISLSRQASLQSDLTAASEYTEQLDSQMATINAQATSITSSEQLIETFASVATVVANDTRFTEALVLTSQASVIDLRNTLLSLEEQLASNELYTNVVGQIASSIVRVSSTNKSFLVGSGFIISEEGHVVTSAHVIDYGDIERGTVYLHDFDGEQTFEAEIVGVAACEDIAVLKLPDAVYTYLSLESPENIAVGDAVVAMGYPQDSFIAANAPSFNDGRINRLGVSISHFPDLIQHEAAIDAGSSGGPLINKKGLVVGLNTFRIDAAQELSFAIGVAQLSEVTSYLIDEQSPEANTEIGVSISGAFDHELDRDCWSFRASAGEELVIELQTTEPEAFTPQMLLYGPTNLLISPASFVENSRTQMRLRVTPQVNGVYTVMIARDKSDTIPRGLYDLTIQRSE
ncbi:MAG: hypothetical protein OHK0046_20950 [Anaerolineae bacterium]